jgi:hypothetical protein
MIHIILWSKIKWQGVICFYSEMSLIKTKLLTESKELLYGAKFFMEMLNACSHINQNFQGPTNRSKR